MPTQKRNKAGRREFLASVGSISTAGLAGGQSSAGREKKPIRVGLIGCGTRGTYLGQIVQQFAKQGEPVELVAVCDIYQPRLERNSVRFKAKAYKDARDLIGDANVDAVIVATPDRLHPHHALAAIRAGKDVYCEKPVAHWQQFDLLKQLVRAVREHKTVFQMGTQRLADPVWRRAAELIQRGDIGKPVHVQMGYFRLGDSGERGMPIDDPNAQPGVGLDWDAFQGDAPKRPFSISRFFQWRMYMDYSGGPATDNDVHFLALMIKALAVGFPKSVVALGGKYHFDGDREVPDTFDMIFQYPEGLNLTFVGSYCNDTSADTFIRGTEGTMRFQEAGLVVDPLPGMKHPHREIPHLDVNQAHMRDFLESVRTREKPQGDIELAYRVQTALIMAMRSFMEDKVAHFDEVAEEIRLG